MKELAGPVNSTQQGQRDACLGCDRRGEAAAVYPIAHRDAITAEMDLLGRFAKSYGLAAPPLALALVAPMVERRQGVTAAMIVHRFKFNPELVRGPVSPGELEAAARVWEAGGYVYRDRGRVITDALAYLRQRG